MTMEGDVTYVAGSGTMIDETRYLLGARGIERLEAQRMASPLPNDPLTTAKRSYPLYDGHGNPDSPCLGGAHFPSAGRKRMIATLGRTATGYTIANEKKYDVWGAVRQSQSPGSHVVNPNKQYCANLGHTFDGESDLIYMRARYYEPSTGRFISEDPIGDGGNWYVYGSNNPVLLVDSTGEFSEGVDTLHGTITKIADFFEKTFGMKVPTSSEVLLKVAGAALEIAYYHKKIQNLQRGLVLAELAAAIAPFTGNPYLIVSSRATAAGMKMGIFFYRALILLTLWSLGQSIHMSLAQDPDAFSLS